MTKEKNIELEYRAIVGSKEFNSVRAKLESLTDVANVESRLSVMYFGSFNKTPIDIRVRITNNVSEIVVKKGSFHSTDRLELSQQINNEQLYGFVRQFLLFGFECKVAERITYNYKLNGGIVASLVSAGPLSYLEVELMSNSKSVDRNRKIILKLINDLHLTNQLMNTKKSFNDFCDLLSQKVDWELSGSKEALNKFKKLLGKYI